MPSDSNQTVSTEKVGHAGKEKKWSTEHEEPGDHVHHAARHGKLRIEGSTLDRTAPHSKSWDEDQREIEEGGTVRKRGTVDNVGQESTRDGRGQHMVITISPLSPRVMEGHDLHDD